MPRFGSRLARRGWEWGTFWVHFDWFIDFQRMPPDLGSCLACWFLLHTLPMPAARFLCLWLPWAKAKEWKGWASKSSCSVVSACPIIFTTCQGIWKLYLASFVRSFDSRACCLVWSTLQGEVQHALAMFARAAKLDVSKLEAALTWLEQKKLLNCTAITFWHSNSWVQSSPIVQSES